MDGSLAGQDFLPGYPDLALSAGALSPAGGIGQQTGRDLGLQITMRPVAKGLSAFVPYEVDEEKNKEIISGPPFGYTCALSTVANITVS